MAGASNHSSSKKRTHWGFSGRDLSDFSKEELLRYVGALDMEIAGKDGIIKSLTGDLSVSSDAIMNNPEGYTLKLENTVTEQNLTIEALREELQHKQRELEQLSEDSFSIKADAANELEELKKELERRKSRWKEEKKLFEAEVAKLRETFERDRSLLDTTLNMEIDKNHLLEKQVETLTSRIEELYHRGLVHEEEFGLMRQHWEDEMNDLRQSCEISPPQSVQNVSLEYVESLRSQLAACWAKNAELNALVKTSEKVRAGDREQLQRNLQELMTKIEDMSLDLKESERKNMALEEASKSHQSDLQTLCEELQAGFQADLLKVNGALKHLQNAVAGFDYPTSDFTTPPISENPDSSNEDNHTCSEDFLNVLLEKIQTCTMEIAKHRTDFFEMRQENEDLIRRCNNMSKNCEELELYKESVAMLKIELDKIKQQYELMLKNNENSIITLKKDLEVSKTEINEKNCVIKRLKDELNLTKSHCDKLERKLEQYLKLRVEGDLCHKEQYDGMEPKKCGHSETSHLSPISKFGITSEVTPPRQVFSSFTTSTPFPTHAHGAGESAPVVANESQDQLHLIRWMEAFQELNAENGLLKNRVSELEMEVKELKLSASGFLEEMKVFESQTRQLELKLSDYTVLKNKCSQLTEELKMNELKMSGLEEELKHLQGLHKKLDEENQEYKNKCMEVSVTESNTHMNSESVFSELNKKAHEVALLKGQLKTLSYSNHTLQARNDQLKELKNIYALKLEETTRELNNCRNEVELLLQNNIQLDTSNKSYVKEVRILTAQLAHLNELKNQNWGLTEKNSMAEQMQKDILALCKEAIERKFEYDKLISDTKKKDCQVEELDARHRVELLMKDNNQLVHEKETLLLTITNLQKMLTALQKEAGCDEGWLQHLETTQTDLLKEIGEHKEQHARIEEALRSTGNLHNELQREKDDKKIKVIELAKMEKKFEMEKLRSQQLEMDTRVLKQEVLDIREIVKVLQSEKAELEESLSAVKSALNAAQGKLEFEKQRNRLRLKHVELQNANNEVLESFLSSSSDEQSLFNLDVEYHQRVREDIERQYADALRNMKRYFAAQFAVKAQELQSDHNDQIKRLKTLVDEQFGKMKELTPSQIISELSQGNQTLPEYNVLLENMDKCKKGIEDAMDAIQDTEDAGKIRNAFKEYYSYQIFLAQKLLQNEYRTQYALTVSSWQQLHESELKLAKFQFEANQFKHKIDQIDEAACDESRSFSLPDVFQNEERHLTTAQLIFHILLKSYFSHVEKYSARWCSAFRKKLKTVSVGLKKEMTNLENQMEKILKTGSLNDEISKSEALVSKGDWLISSAKGFVESIRGFKGEFLSNLTSALDSVSDVTKKTLDEFKRDYGRVDDFLKLEEEVKRLLREKEESEKQYKAAVELLKSDHDLEVKRLESILTELKHISEIGCRADSLLNLKEELEAKHKKEMEELRTYFERTVVDLEKNFSEEVFSQHSRKMSSSSSCPEDYSDRDKFAPPDLLCETGSVNDSRQGLVDVNEIFPEKSKSCEFALKNNYATKKPSRKGCTDCFDCAAKVLSRVMLEESHAEVQQELVQAVHNHGLEDLRSPYDRQRLFTQGVTDWEVEERESSIVARTIQKIGAECFKSLENHIIGDVTGKLRSYESFMVNQLSAIKKKVDIESTKLERIADRLATYKKTCLENSFSEKEFSRRCSTPNEVERLLKDRSDLEKLKKTLRGVVTEMSQYLMNSENDLMKQIREELHKLCEETVGNPDTGDSDEPKPPKRVHFESNLSTIIQELDDTMNESTQNWSHDASTRFRADIISCIKKLKLEAMALYNFSNQISAREEESNKLESEIEFLRKENSVLHQEMSEIKITSINHLAVPDCSLLSYCNQLESVYSDCEEQLRSHVTSSDYLQNKARKHLQQVKDSALSKVIEDIVREGDLAIDELQNRCDDLKQQVEVADKQLRSNWQFLEEQAADRETEVDELSTRLQTLVKEKDRETSARERLSREVDELSKELKETSDQLAESKDKEKLLQSELKVANDQELVLRDIIRNLELQVTARSEREAELERKIGSLEQELEEKNGTQSLMAHEIETLRNQSLEDSRGLEQLQELEDNIKLKFNSSVIRQFQAQIKEMGKILDSQTKELEGNHIGASTNSLSSPSEEISIREHIEFLNRSKTPEHCPSPVSLPVDDVNKLNEKIQRHARADEVILKKLSDQELRLGKLTNYAEEIQAERDILHGQVEKLKAQIAEANNKIDFLRHKADASNVAANRDIILDNQKLKDALSDVEQTLEKVSHQLHEKESQLGNAEQVIASQQDKLRSLALCDENALESLRLEFASVLAEKNKLEGFVEKYKRDLENYRTHPADLKALLADKNEDIKLLQETIARIHSGTEKSSSRSAKGLKVSFADDLDELNSFSSEESKLRDAPGNESFQFEVPSQIIAPLKSSTHQNIEDSVLQHPRLDPIADVSTSQKGFSDGSATEAVDKLKLELVKREERICKLEQQLSDFKQIELDLLRTKTELEHMVMSITEDKKYYEEQLTSMLNEIKERDDKCCTLERRLTEKATEAIKLSADIQTLQNLVRITQEKLEEAQMLAERNVERGNDDQLDTAAVQTVTRLESEIERLSSEKQSLVRNLAELTTQSETLQNELGHLRSEYCEIKAELSEIKALKKVKDGEFDEMVDLKVDLEKKFTDASKEVLDLKTKLAKFEMLQKNFEKTQEQMSSAKSENESLQATLNNMRIVYEQQSVETSQFKQDHSKVVELQSELRSLKEQVREMGNSLNKETLAKNCLENRLKSLSVDFEFLKNEKEKLLNEKNVLTASNEALRKELDNFNTSVQELLEEKNQLAISNDQMREEHENFKASVQKLRSDLASLKKREGPYISLLSQIDCDDVKKLYLEVSKLISEVGQLEFQKNCLQEELARMKPTGVEIALKESELDKLAEQISRLEAVNAELKASNHVSAEQLRAEIVKLSQDIKFLQTIEQQASERVAASHAENRKFGSKLNRIEKELHQVLHARKSTSEVGSQITPVPDANRAPEICQQVPEHDERIQRLDVIPHRTNRSQQTTQESQFGNTALEVAVYEKMRDIEALKEKLRVEESITRALRAEKLDVELDLKTLEKVNALQERKLDILDAQVRKLNSDRLQLELDVHNEKTSRLHAEAELSSEKMKTQSMQMENINMIENMRSRLKLAIEAEEKLKALVLEKHAQYESAVAKYNNVMVMERYKCESENEGCSSSLQKRYADCQDVCRSLKMELEKQERLNADLSSVLARERRTLTSTQEHLKALECQSNKLRTDLRNEITKREILQDQVKEYMLGNDRSSTDSHQVQSLQHDCARLREKVKILQELNEQWRACAYTPVLEQLNELNSNVDSLTNKKRDLQSAVNDLERERHFLCGQINQLREERANMRLSSEKMDFAPSVSAKLDIYLGRYFRAESYRKSLVAQKKYLMVVLSGFEKSHQNTLAALVGGFSSPRRRLSFKGVAQAVIAVSRMKFFVRKRKVACETAYLGLLRTLGITSEEALNRAAGYDSGALASVYQNYSNSPPTKDRPQSEVTRRHKTQTALHSDYLAALQEVQKITRKT